jgi:hypothetical protein
MTIDEKWWLLLVAGGSMDPGIFTIHIKYFCIPITFNNPLKFCFSNKKYLITI